MMSSSVFPVRTRPAYAKSFPAISAGVRDMSELSRRSDPCSMKRRRRTAWCGRTPRLHPDRFRPPMHDSHDATRCRSSMHRPLRRTSPQPFGRCARCHPLHLAQRHPPYRNAARLQPRGLPGPNTGSRSRSRSIHCGPTCGTWPRWCAASPEHRSAARAAVDDEPPRLKRPQEGIPPTNTGLSKSSLPDANAPGTDPAPRALKVEVLGSVLLSHGEAPHYHRR